MGHGREFHKMSRWTARLLLLPLALLPLMATKPRSRHTRSGKSTQCDAPKAILATALAETPAASSSAPDAIEWRESTLKQMSVEEKVGQLLFTTYRGGFSASDSATYADMMRDVEQLHVGG